MRLGLLLIDGLRNPQGDVLVPPDVAEGRRLLELADAAGDVRAAGYLADAHRFGPLELRDVSAARRLYVKVATALPLPNLSHHARQEIDAIDRAEFLKAGSDSFDDPAIGPASASVKVVFYLTPSCVDCEVMTNDSLRGLTQTYLNIGGVRFVLRLVAAAGQANDLDATVLAQCVPRDTRYAIRDTRYAIRDTRYAIRDTRYAFITRLIANQDDWSAQLDRAVRDRSFGRLLAAMGPSMPSLQACMANADNRSAVLARQDMAVRLMKPVVGRRPIAFVNGAVVNDVTAEALDRAIRASLPQTLAGSHRP